MLNKEFHYRWVWDLQSNPEDLWPLVSDTNRFDRDTGLPPLDDLTGDGRLPNARIRARFYRFGIPLEYEQDPFEWIRPYRFGVVRNFSTGPVAQLRVLADMRPLPEGGTRLTYQSWARPANPLGLIAIPIQIGFMSRRDFGRVFKQYDRLVARGQMPYEADTQVTFEPRGRERLAEMAEATRQQSRHPEIVDHLVHLIETADNLTLAQIRPYALADYWDMDRQAVLETCLLATRVGLLTFQWDLLCPLCRGTKARYPTLGEVEPVIHCDTCNIDFDINFDRAVELTFQPNPAIRSADMTEYCINAPSASPHVAVQQLLQPGEERTLEPVLETGRYRFRALEMRGGQYIRVGDEGREQVQLAADGDWSSDEIAVSSRPALTFANDTREEQLLILERMAWTDQAATAAEVTTLQRFRDLFADEALRPGERIAVGSLTVLFTDLRGSTSIYREIGDARAFGLVMDHFDVLKECIAAEGGAIVKNIGDAIMAVFQRPVEAIRAIQAARHRLQRPSDGGRPLLLKAGIHHGPCIAVTLNDRLDYFGSTVNAAARLEAMCTGREIIISDATYRDPEVLAYLEDPTNKLIAEPREVALKGFDDEQFVIWLVSENGEGAPASGKTLQTADAG